MKEIQLVRTHRVALVDDEDYEYLNQFRWYCSYQRNTFYAVTHNEIGWHPIPAGMHRVILHATNGTMIDHIDGNGLNNQKSNLRFATYSDNAKNRKPNKGHEYKGVRKDGNKFCAVITANKQIIRIGLFDTRKEAAIAYNEAALKYHGKFARLNIITDLPLHYKLMMLSK